MNPIAGRDKQRLLSVVLLVTLLLIAVTALYGLGWPAADAVEYKILWQLRMPAVITALIVGAGLSVSAACLQVLLRNPLADPGIIGITSGASLAAAILLLSAGTVSLPAIHYWLPLACFIGALLSTLFIYLVARRIRGHGVILAGIAVSTLSGALVAWMHLFSDAQSMRNLTFWLMGSLQQADWSILALAAPTMALLIGYSLSKGQALNWLYMGGNSARVAGLDVDRFNRIMLLVCALMVGVAVSIAGSIAFVGLIVPHFLRHLVGHDNRLVLPLSAMTGGGLMLLVLLVNQWAGGVSIPVSMLTATIGGPLFLLALLKFNRTA